MINVSIFRGKSKNNINKFETRYAQMYSQAIVILPKDNEEPEETQTAAVNEDISDSDTDDSSSDNEAWEDEE